MEIVEAQVHANHRGIDQSIAIMDAVGSMLRLLTSGRRRATQPARWSYAL